MSTAELRYGDPQSVAEWLETVPFDQIEKEDLVAALINALSRVAELEKRP